MAPNMRTEEHILYNGKPHYFLLLRSAGYYYDIPFKPVVADPLLPHWPYEILGSGKLHIRHRIMLGVNKDEGMFHIIQALRKYFLQHNHWPEMPRDFEYQAGTTDPMDLLAFYIMDENFLHPTLLQATVFEYQVSARVPSTLSHYGMAVDLFAELGNWLANVSSPYEETDRRGGDHTRRRRDIIISHIPSRALGKTDWRAKEVLQALNEVGGDYNIKCPVVEFADFYSRAPNSQVFMYSFEHRTQASPWPQWTGVMQGYEAEYIFGAPFNPDYQKRFYNFTDEERRLSEEMMRFWTNFASTGSPNLNPGEFHTRNRNLYWERYTSNAPTSGTTFKEEMVLKSSPKLVADTSRKHMVFRLPESYMERNLQRHRCMFWREQLPLMREQLLFSKQLKVLHQATHVPVAKIFELSRYMYICNALLMRLLKIRRQLTTGFALLGSHRVGAVPEFPSTNRRRFSFGCSTPSVPNCHATRSRHEGWDTARLPKPRQGKSGGRGRVRATDLPVNGPCSTDKTQTGGRSPPGTMGTFYPEPPKRSQKGSNNSGIGRSSTAHYDHHLFLIAVILFGQNRHPLNWLTSLQSQCHLVSSNESLSVPGHVIYGMLETVITVLQTIVRHIGTRWPKWLEREFADRKVRGSNPTSVSRLPLSRLGQPGSIPALVQPSAGMA
ncbi:hypothetical protein T265_13551, partial [Opisthorchis viverrini]